MPNVLTVPASGIIQFNKTSFSNFTLQPLSASVQLEGDTEGGLRIYSTATAATATDRFFVDGKEGRLFTVSDVLTGTLFSANDISGLPILEVKDTDTVVMGEYNTNTLVVSGKRIGVGNNPFTNSILSVSGNITTTGTISANIVDISSAIMISPNGTRYRLTMANDGSLSSVIV